MVVFERERERARKFSFSLKSENVENFSNDVIALPLMISRLIFSRLLPAALILTPLCEVNVTSLRTLLTIFSRTTTYVSSKCERKKIVFLIFAISFIDFIARENLVEFYYARDGSLWSFGNFLNSSNCFDLKCGQNLKNLWIKNAFLK
jgi:hypothetical protein